MTDKPATPPVTPPLSPPATPLFSATPDGVQFTVKLTPKAAKTAILGTMHDEDGEQYLKAGVTAPPEDGKANKALIELLSKHFGAPKSGIDILSGETSRKKRILISGGEAESMLRAVEDMAHRKK